MKTLKLALGAFALLVLSAGWLPAEAPVGKIAYQGRLTDADNNPVSGNQSIRFSIWDTGPGSGGTELWNETQSVSVDRGLVSVNLGDVTVVPGRLFDQATTYLEIKVGADAAMSPRIRLLPSPYAFNAQTLQGSDFAAFVTTYAAQTVGGNKTLSGKLILTDVSADALDVAGGINAGSGNVGIVDATGKIPALTGTYFASLDGGAITNVGGGSIGSGSTNYVQNRASLQSGATFYVSSGTAQSLFAGQFAAGPSTFSSLVTASSLSVTGTVASPAGFVGVGSTLTLLNASSLALGQVPNERIDPSSVAMWNDAGKIENFRLDPSSVAMWNAAGRIENFRIDSSSVAKWNAAGQIPNFRLDPSSVAMWNASGKIESFRLDPSSITMYGPIRSRSIIGIWSRVNLAANLTDSQLLLVPNSAAVDAVAGNSLMPMPFGGIVRGVIVSGSAARTAGSATFNVFKNGSTNMTSSAGAIDGTNTQYVASSAGNETFVAGDRLDVRATTTSNWAPTTAEWFVQIVVEWTN